MESFLLGMISGCTLFLMFDRVYNTYVYNNLLKESTERNHKAIKELQQLKDNVGSNIQRNVRLLAEIDQVRQNMKDLNDGI